jgi:hypothetical protein
MVASGRIARRAGWVPAAVGDYAAISAIVVTVMV